MSSAACLAVLNGEPELEPEQFVFTSTRVSTNGVARAILAAPSTFLTPSPPVVSRRGYSPGASPQTSDDEGAAAASPRTVAAAAAAAKLLSRGNHMKLMKLKAQRIRNAHVGGSVDLDMSCDLPILYPDTA